MGAPGSGEEEREPGVERVGCGAVPSVGAPHFDEFAASVEVASPVRDACGSRGFGDAGEDEPGGCVEFVGRIGVVERLTGVASVGRAPPAWEVDAFSEVRVGENPSGFMVLVVHRADRASRPGGHASAQGVE